MELQRLFRIFVEFFEMLVLKVCQSGEIGRLVALKMQFTEKVSAGSSPASGTKWEGELETFDGLYPHRMSYNSLRVAIEEHKTTHT